MNYPDSDDSLSARRQMHDKHPTLASLTGLIQKAKAALRRLGAAPRKKMGQHFMIREENLEAVAEALHLREGETVLEIGPGLGFLTRHLLKRQAQVVAVEKDKKYAEYLRRIFRGQKLEIIEADILKIKVDRGSWMVDGGQGGGSPQSTIHHLPSKVVGNIPYNITSPLLEWLILQKSIISKAILTVQWEVALRLMAKPGTKEWGALSIFVQVYARVTLVKKIHKSHFYPAPRVDSAVVKLTFSDKPFYSIQNEEFFFELVRRAFQKRRKTLLNSLKDDEREKLSKQALLAAFEKGNIDPRRRPETLSIPEWAALADILS